MYLALTLLTSAHAAPSDPGEEEAALAFAAKMEQCKEFFTWEHCLGELPAKTFGSTGLERITDWLDEVEVVLEPDAYGVNVFQDGTRVGRLLVRDPVEYFFLDADRDGWIDLVVRDGEGRMTVLPREAPRDEH